MANPELRVAITGDLAGFSQAIKEAVEKSQAFGLHLSQGLQGVRTQFQKAAGEARALSEGLGKAGSSTKGLSEGLQRVEQSSDGAGRSFVRAGAGLAAYAAGLRGLKTLLERVIQTTMDLEKTTRTLQYATGDGGAAMAFVRETAQELGLEISGTAQAFGKFAAAARGTSLEGAQTRDVFKAVAGAATVMGLGAEETHGMFLALSQMISKGKVQAEELRKQLGERLPGAFQIAARAMGVTTRELDKMLEQGKILADDFLPRFGAQLRKELGDAPLKASQSLQAQINRMKNAWTELLQAVGRSGVLATAAEEAGKLGKSLEAAAANGFVRGLADDLGRLLHLLGSVTRAMVEHRAAITAAAYGYMSFKGAQILLGFLDRQKAKLLEHVAVLEAERQARILAQQALVQEALAIAGHTAVTLKDDQANLALARTLLMKKGAAILAAEATGAMSLADAAAAKQSLALAAAKLQEAEATLAATAAGRAGTGVLGLVGGSLGAVSLALGAAAAAWSYFGRSAKEATDQASQGAEKAKGAVESLTEKLFQARNRLDVLNQKEVQTPGSLTDARFKHADPEVLEEAAKLRLHLGLLEEQAKRYAGRKLTALDEKHLVEMGYVYDGLSKKLEYLAARQADLDKLNQQIKAREGGGAPKKDNAFPAELRRLAEERLKFAEKLTLQEQEQVELKKLALDLEEHRARIGKEAAEGKLTPAQKAEALAEVQALQAEGEASIRAKFVRQREQMEADLQAKLTAQEEKGLEQRLEAVRKHFTALREEAAKLAEKGQPVPREADIQKAEDTALDRARQDQVKQDLQDLKKHLSELGQIKGPLTQGEILTEMETFAQRSDTAREAMEKLKAEMHMGDGPGAGFAMGLRQALGEMGNDFEQFRQLALDVAGSIRQGFGTLLDELILKGKRFSGALSAAWKSISQSAVQALSKIVSSYLAKWALEKAMWAWDKLKSAWNTANTTKEVAQSTTKTAANSTEASSNIGTAATGIFKAHSGIPFVGVALAAGFVLAMMAVLSKITARAVGGLVTRPELTLLGEAGPEVVAPERDFKDWARGLAAMGPNLQANLATSQGRIQGYQERGAEYAAGARDALQARGEGEVPAWIRPEINDFRGAIILDESAWQEKVQEAREGYKQRNR